MQYKGRFGLFTFLNQNFKLKPICNFLRGTLLIFVSGRENPQNCLDAIYDCGFGFRNQNPGPCWLYKVLLHTCLISFSKHVEVIMAWLEEGTERPEAAFGNKSKWNMCHLESCAVPAGRAGFCIKLVSWFLSLLDLSKLHGLPHTSPAVILTDLCVYVRVCNNKIALSEDLKNTSAVIPGLFPPPRKCFRN